jgi:pyridoxine kinase
VVEDAVVRVRAANPRTLYCCDPVIGEVGRGAYVRAGIPETFRDRLVPLADIVTPNPFELELLSGIAPVDLPAARDAARVLLGRGPALVVATGLQLREAPGQLAVLAATRDEAWLVRHPRRVVRVWGTGDAFAALFLGAYLPRRDARAALEHAVAALDGVLAVAERTDADELPLVAAQDALVHPRTRFGAEAVWGAPNDT